MTDRERLEQISSTATELGQKLVDLSYKIAEQGMYVEDLQECIYHAGFIEGLCYGVKDGD